MTPSWTELGDTANAGDTEITVDGKPTWFNQGTDFTVIPLFSEHYLFLNHSISPSVSLDIATQHPTFFRWITMKMAISSSSFSLGETTTSTYRY